MREKWFAATTDTERNEIIAQLPVVLKPWIDKVTREKTAMEQNIIEAGFDPAALPGVAEMVTSASSARKLYQQINKLQKKIGAKLKKGQRVQIDKLIAAARKLLGEIEDLPVADDTAAVMELNRLAPLVNVYSTKYNRVIGVKKRLLERLVLVRAYRHGCVSNKALNFSGLRTNGEGGVINLSKTPVLT